MAVEFILFDFANNSSSIAVELRDPRQTNMSPEHYF